MSTLQIHFNCIAEHTYDCQCWMRCKPDRKPSIIVVERYADGNGFCATRPVGKQVLASAASAEEIVQWAAGHGIRAEVL